MVRLITIHNPAVCRAIAGHPDFTSDELCKAEPDGHKYRPGETRTLIGLVDFPEYNGQEVKITAIRMNGPKGKAYYVEGKINDVVNWVYEYRLV